MKHDLRLSELKAERSVNIYNGRIGRGNTSLCASEAAIMEQTEGSFVEREAGDAKIAFGVDCGQPYVGRGIFERGMQEADRFTFRTYRENILPRRTPGQR